MEKVVDIELHIRAMGSSTITPEEIDVLKFMIDLAVDQAKAAFTVLVNSPNVEAAEKTIQTIKYLKKVKEGESPHDCSLCPLKDDCDSVGKCKDEKVFTFNAETDAEA